MELQESVGITGYLACHIAWRGILDWKIGGEAFSKGKAKLLGIPDYLPYLKGA